MFRNFVSARNEESVFFFEKSSKKLVSDLASAYPKRLGPVRKSFLLLF
jgi:hypothetical protein